MNFEKIFREAKQAARDAVAKEVSERPEDPWALDCGFAWVDVHPARGPFITWLKKQIVASGDGLEGREQVLAVQNASRIYGSKGWNGGWNFWSPGNFHGQSIRIHEKGAIAFAEVLKKNGIEARAGSRLD